MVVTVLLFVIMLAGMSTVFPTNKPVASVEGVGLFGGRILTIVRCDNPAKKFITIGGLFGGSFIYVPPPMYLSGPPSHLGQFLIGFSPGLAVCKVKGAVVGGRLIFKQFGSGL